MKTRLIFTLATPLLFNGIASAQQYIIDPGHSSVQIRIQRFGVVDVVGRFKDVSGSITYDFNKVSKTAADATIIVSSYDANNSGGEEFVIDGSLTIKDQKRSISLPCKLNALEDGSVSITGKIALSRKAFGLEFGAMNALIGAEIKVRIDLTFK